jgi:hypothetical protein
MSVARPAPFDAALPGLADALDGDRMVRALSALVPPVGTDGSDRRRIRACEVIRVKYRPGTSAVIGYRISTEDSGDGVAPEHVACGAMYPAAEARRRYEKAATAPRADGGLLPAVSLIDGLDMILWVFPTDRTLEALPLLADFQRLRDEPLARLARQRWGERCRIAGVSPRVVSYVPEHTCSVRAEVRLEDGDGGALRPWSVFAKTRYDGAGSETFRVMRDLWASAAHVRGEIGLARPLEYDPAHRLLWQEAVDGEPLPDGPTRRTAALLGRALAAFHGTGIGSAREVGLSGILDGLEQAARMVGLVRPQGHERANAIVGRLRARAGTLRRGPRVTLHGDLHGRNVLIRGDRVTLIDLDRVSEGPPVAELGSLAAEIVYRSARASRGLEAATPLLDALVSSYRRYAMWAVPAAEVDWYTAAALLGERILRCLTSLKPGWTEIVDELIEYADRLSLRLVERAGVPPTAGVV